MEPGPELDRQIAELIGDDDLHAWEQIGASYTVAAHVCRRCGEGVLDDIDPPKNGCLRPFSTEPAAAIYAAEKVGLFENSVLKRGGVAIGGRAVRTWKVSPDDHSKAGSMAKTPALAICAAILAAKESP